MKFECEIQCIEQVHKEVENENGKLKKEADEVKFKMLLRVAERQGFFIQVFLAGSWFYVWFQYVKPQLKKYMHISIPAVDKYLDEATSWC